MGSSGARSGVRASFRSASVRLKTLTQELESAVSRLRPSNLTRSSFRKDSRRPKRISTRKILSKGSHSDPGRTTSSQRSPCALGIYSVSATETDGRRNSHVFINLKGRIFRRFNHRFWAAKSLEEQYKIVEETDAEVLELWDQFPQLKPTPTPYSDYVDLEGTLPLEEWTRHHLGVGVPWSRMLIHRFFLRKSYEDPAFRKSRTVSLPYVCTYHSTARSQVPVAQICLESARSILRERRRVVPALYDRPW